MGFFPWRSILLSSFATAYLVLYRTPGWSTRSFLGIAAGAWTVQLLLWAVWTVILYPKVFSPLRHLPEPKNPSFFMGQWSRIVAEPTGVPMMDWTNNVPNNGLIRYLGLFNQERILVTSPKALAEVLVTKNYDFKKPSLVTASISSLLGVGVLLAEGDEHKRQRRNLMPAFAFRHVKDLYPVFWQKSREGVDAMTQHIHSELARQAASHDVEKDGTVTIEAGSWASRITLDIIGVAGLGQDFGAIRDPTNPLNQAYQRVFKSSRQAQILTMLTHFLPLWFVRSLPVRRNDDIHRSAKVIRETCHDLIREKKEKQARKALADVDILSVALESGGFSDENLVDQLMTFLAAGHETTASAMTWAVYLLCLHPDVQTRLRAEVRDRLPAPSPGARDASSPDVDGAPYLHAVCSEVLRCYAPVPMTLREAAVDTSLAGTAVPRGTRVIVCPWAVNKSAALWGADAARFDPDRWMSKPAGGGGGGGGGAESNYAFMTFLHGPRSCIGQAFARAEFACLLAAWIGRFEFALAREEERDEEKMVIRGGITARPANGMHVKVKVVEGW